LLSGTYKPQPVRRKEIDKPDGGGVRKLGIPTVVDRLIQQAVMQVLQKRWDRTFSEHSYGFRPGRSAHQAVKAAQQHIAAGYRWVVDLDLEKFFDSIPHDKLQACLRMRIADRTVRKLIRMWLETPVVEAPEEKGGAPQVSRPQQGTPQGGVTTA
jgi:RNA-directed DNA polymerase